MTYSVNKTYTEYRSQTGKVEKVYGQVSNSYYAFVAPFTCGNSLAGEKMPNWRSNIAKGISATTPLTASTVTLSKALNPASILLIKYSTPPGQWEARQEMRDYYMHATAPSVLNTALEASVDNEAKALYWKRMANSFNGAATLVELKKTVLSLLDPAAALRKFLIETVFPHHKKIRDDFQKRGSKHKPFADALAGSWLEYNFGLMPVLMDIQGALDEILAFIANNQDNLQKFTIRKFGEAESAPERYRDSGWQYVSWTAYRRVKDQVMVKYLGACSTHLDVDTLPEVLGLSPENWIPAGWETMPWSWMFDYFSTIGDVLNAQATVQRVKLSWGQKTVVSKRAYIYALKMRPTDPKTSTTLQSKEGWSTITKKTVTRTAIGGIPTPDFSLRCRLGNIQLLNLASVLNGFKLDTGHDWKLAR